MPRPGILISDRYRLDERIASGGMGEVWRGIDPVLQRTVAVKVLLPALVSDAEFITRFRTEARMMAALRHPGIVQVYDYGTAALEDESPRDYLVMEYIEGTSLTSRIKSAGKLGVPATLSVLTQAAEALQVAHAAGIVHRDVKPSNLMVRPDGTIVLVDFGVARSADVTGITSASLIVGSPQYMAPEQVVGQLVTAATDIYALGAVAYCCLTGRPPFTGDSTVQVIAQLLHGEPAPLPAEIPAAVAELVVRALSKDPAKRFATAAALAEAARAATATMIEKAPVTAASALPRPYLLPPLPVAPSVRPGPIARPGPKPGATPGGKQGATPGGKQAATPGAKRRNAIVAGVVAVAIAAATVTTALALRPGADTAEVQAGPSASISAAAALGDDAGIAPGTTAGDPTPTPADPDPDGAGPNNTGPNNTGPNNADPTSAQTHAGAGAEPSATANSAPPPPPPDDPATGPAPTPNSTPKASPKPTPKAPKPSKPEVNKAVATTGKRTSGPCSAKLIAGYGCYAKKNDIWWVYDTKSDSHSAAVFWTVGSGSAKRTGRCVNSLGVGKIGTCNKNFPAGLKGTAKVCIMDADTKKVWECTATFSFTTS